MESHTHATALLFTMPETAPQCHAMTTSLPHILVSAHTLYTRASVTKMCTYIDVHRVDVFVFRICVPLQQATAMRGNLKPSPVAAVGPPTSTSSNPNNPPFRLQFGRSDGAFGYTLFIPAEQVCVYVCV